MQLPAVILLCLAASANAVTHFIQVGDKNGDTIYTPPTVNAVKGDFVTFVFQQKNHSVTESSFERPCTPKHDGFDSGFHPVGANVTSDFPTFTLPIQHDHETIFFHCEQAANTAGSHCGKGMVGIINPRGHQDISEFRAKALLVGKQLATPPKA